jgi:iron complex outermembrane receptor protein
MFYARLATAYRLPTTSALYELSANTIASEVQPERAISREVGIRWIDSLARIEIAVYADTVHNGIVQVQTASGARAFENAAVSNHKGVELLVQLKPHSQTMLSWAYGYAVHRYSTYESALGNFSGREIKFAPRNVSI